MHHAPSTRHYGARGCDCDGCTRVWLPMHHGAPGVAEHGMAWLASLGLNSTGLAWRSLADSLSQTTGAWAQVAGGRWPVVSPGPGGVRPPGHPRRQLPAAAHRAGHPGARQYWRPQLEHVWPSVTPSPQYTLNGDYEAVQDATRETLTSTLSWLDLTTFQVRHRHPARWTPGQTSIFDPPAAGEAAAGVLCDLPGQLAAGAGGLGHLRRQDPQQVHDRCRIYRQSSIL